MNKTIIVTGGAGFIGSHTVVELAASGYQPVIIDNLSNSERSVLEGIRGITGYDIPFYEGDFQDATLMSRIIKKHKPNGVIHFAAYKAVGESVEQPLKYYRNNVVGLIELLAILEIKGVPNFVFSSSCTVYGNPDTTPVTEDAPLKPAASPYGATKQMGESIIFDTTNVSSLLKSISLRYFNPIGAHESGSIGELPIGVPANLVPFITQTAAGIRPLLTVHGNDYPTPDGSCIRDYIHVVDLAKAHIKAYEHIAKQPAGYYNVCNIGTGTGKSVLEVIQIFEQTTGQKVPFKIGPRRPGDVVATYAGTEKGEALLGWKAEKSLSEALNDAWRWQNTLKKPSASAE